MNEVEVLHPWFDDPIDELFDEWVDGDENEEEFVGFDEEGHEEFGVKRLILKFVEEEADR